MRSSKCTVARNGFKTMHVPWFTRPSCLTAKLSNAPWRPACTSDSARFVPFFSSCTVNRQLRDCDQCPEPITLVLISIIHTRFASSAPLANHRDGLVRISSQLRPRYIWCTFRIRVTQYTIGGSSGRSVSQIRSRRNELPTIQSPGANFISLARAVLSASRKNRRSRVLVDSRP